jgi:ethanolamine utilization protein EutN
MRVCRVIGNVVSTVKHPTYYAQRLMIVQRIDSLGADVGTSFLAIDRVQSGPGDRVIVMSEGNGVRQLFQMGEQLPIRSIIVGVVDQIDVA